MPSQSASRRQRNERLAEVQKQQAAAERKRRLVWWGASSVVVLVLVGLIVVAVINKNGGSNTPQSTNPNQGDTNLSADGTKLDTGEPLNTSAPTGNPLTWALPADPQPYVAAANLTPGTEMLQVHYHAHIDVIDDGQPVQVPQGLGFVGSSLTYVHTHDTTGVIHMESPAAEKFTLGQVFTEWGVRLTPTCVGGLCTDNTKVMKIFVDGKPYTGDPQKLPMKSLQEIAIWYGDKTATPDVPKTFDFAAHNLSQ